MKVGITGVHATLPMLAPSRLVKVRLLAIGTKIFTCRGHNFHLSWMSRLIRQHRKRNR